MVKKLFVQIALVSLLATQAVGLSVNTNEHVAVPRPPEKSFRLFEDDDLLEITLRFDLSSYLRNKPKEGYLKAKITFHPESPDSLSRNIKLRTRGIFRKSYCYYPPIELNFKKVDFGYSDLNKIAKMKLVPQCRSGIENEKYVLKEYLIYKLFNLMSDTSFRVRLLRINYVDSEGKRKSFSQYGFFIEPVAMLVSRTNSVEIKSDALNQKNIFPEVMDRLAIFNYMIGNYDWSIPGRHNVKIIKHLVIDPLQLGIAIPYDFDWTGFVDASYAVPAEIVGVETVRERLFLGVCRSRSTYENELKEFTTLKDDFYRVINDFPYLDKREKKTVISYLDEFYDNMTGYNNVTDIFLRTCKNY
jgi:hypothetical protein